MSETFKTLIMLAEEIEEDHEKFNELFNELFNDSLNNHESLNQEDNSMYMKRLFIICIDNSKYYYLECILKQGFNPNVLDNGNYPILYTTQKKTIELLLKYGADVNCLSETYTPLMQQARSHNSQELLEFYCNVDGIEMNKKNKEKETAMFYAIKMNILENVKILDRYGGVLPINSYSYPFEISKELNEYLTSMENYDDFASLNKIVLK